jgi:hypothetical protein
MSEELDEKGIITPTFFTMIVIMAIATTLMASPLFEWAYSRWKKQEQAIPSVPERQPVSPSETFLS